MEDNFPPNVSQNSSLHDFEFCKIYFEAGKKLLDFEERSNADYINRYYKFFTKYFNHNFGFFGVPEHDDHDFETIKLLKESLYYRIIYVLRNSPILSSAVAFHFQNILNEDFNYLRKVLTRKQIKICSIGGGAASDVVAVVKILESLAVKMANQLDFRITIIDSDASWKNTCLTVLSGLKSFRGATWKIKFIAADVSDKNSCSSEVIQSIQEADIVLMVMFLYEFVNENLDAKDTVKEVSELMQYGSMLFLLDLELIEHIRSCFGLFGENENCFLIYENLCDLHILNEAATFNSYISYKKHFTHLMLKNNLTVFVRAWIKTPTKEISGTRIELQHRFKKDIESFDPVQIFQDHDFLENWLITRANRKRKAGWSVSSINEFLQDKKQKILHFLDKLAERKENLEAARKELVSKNLQLEEGKHNGTFKEAWERYILEKKDYREIKKHFFDNIFREHVL